MKIGFYNPYFDGLGGGERYTLTLASHWSKRHDVSLFWDDASIVETSALRFGLDLTHVKVVPNLFLGKNGFVKALKTRAYDLIFFLSDGSVPFSLSKYTILHFQVPFSTIHTTPLHLSRVNAIVCNSNFTKDNLDLYIKEKAIVIYPPTDAIKDAPLVKKSKIIFSVGRFTASHTAKKQQDLIAAFKKIEPKLSGWRLVLAGGLLESDREFFTGLSDLSSGHAIELLPNIPHNQIVSLYRKASLYWHAAGLGETDPQYMEHFGISTVEAMRAGAVPIVYQGGGQVEIVRDNENGLLWKTREELCEKTLSIIKDNARFTTLAQKAIETSQRYTTKVFTDAFDKLLDGILAVKT